MSTGKFKTLVHYIVHECRDDPGRLGSVRLNKALWFTDMIAYQADGVSVTGETYVKRRNGPVPKTILATLRELEKERKIHVREPEYRFDSRKFISLATPKSDSLSDGDRTLVKLVLDFVCQHKANEISERTHDEIWNAAEEGEIIPLYATLASGMGAITEKTIAWAESVIREREAA